MRRPSRTVSVVALTGGLFAFVGTLFAGASLGACGSDQTNIAPPTPDAAAPTPEAGPAPIPPLEATPPAIIAPDKRLDGASSSIVFDAERGGVWTANGDVGSVSYVDVGARHVVREVPVGKDIRSVALSPDFKWLAAVDRDGAAVTLLDANTATVVRTIALGTHPRAAVWDSANPRWLYVAVEDDDAIALVDRSNGVLTTTIPVGRLPSGVAVSRQRREVYVTHRVDATVTIVDLAARAVSAEVPLADEPASGDPTVPNGKPFAFESLAWAADGNVAWLPHELLAPTHPFQFQSTLFPAVSVVDLSARSEVQTDPNDPTGTIAGRKNLFDAINILDSGGNPSVLSQPCAAVLHGGGFVGYALACASEDLIVFDVSSGIAIDLIRNLPGDHPTGLALDGTGARLFSLSDQSHTLLTFDTGGGSLVNRTTLFGDPIALVAKDPVDAEMRAGLELFFRANSAKGDYATTANDWMSCGGCHLDGFVSTNKFFFEALSPATPATDAQIGHVGLKDLFSTAPAPHDPSFNPNDILIALLDQGGLDQDRTGAHPANVVVPSAPPPAVATMATEIARVIQRDLPVGPSWLLDTSPKPNETYDGQWCAECHQTEYDAWSKSVHSRSADDPMMTFCAGVEDQLRGPQFSRHCAGCHDPVSARLGDTSLASKRGVTCLGCHDVTRTIRAGGNADLQAASHDWTTDHKDWGKASLDTLRDPRFCGGCHQQFVPGTGLLPSFTTLNEWQASAYATSTPPSRCVDCHMPVTAGVADHRAVGGNLYMGNRVGAQDLVTDQTARITTFMTLAATKSGTGVAVDLFNKGSGHAFPTGVSDIREAWVEVQALDASKKVLARIGGPGEDGLLPETAVRLGTDIASADGTTLLRHELSATTRITFDQRVMPQQHLKVTVPLPANLPAGTAELDAVLFFRNVRTTYYRAATGDASGTAPETELARAQAE